MDVNLDVSTDPKDFPRSARVTDDESRLLIDECEVLRDRMREAQTRLEAVQRDFQEAFHRREAAKAMLFRRLIDHYPGVAVPGGSYKFAKHEDVYWFVGWGEAL